jgi:hypothetical protein
MDKWELNRVERLEDRLNRLEQKNWERSTVWFNFAVYGMVTAFLVFAAVMITINASNS